MKFQVYPPSEPLMPYVRHLVISEHELENSYQVLPDTALVLGFQYRGKLSYGNGAERNELNTAGVTGLTDTYRVFHHSGAIGTVLVVFRENGAARFLRTPLQELFGESLSLEHFFPAAALAQLEEQLVTAGGYRSRIDLVEAFLIDRLDKRAPDLLVTRALELIHDSNGTIRISELARQLNTSASPLEKRFRQEVGASPKKFATIVRARQVLSAMENGRENYAAYLSAFYDQPHFIKDFKKFAAVTPEQYLKGLK